MLSLLSILTIVPAAVLAAPLNSKSGCWVYWLIPGCPLSNVFGYDALDIYDWDNICALYPENKELQASSYCNKYKQNIQLDTLEAQLSNFNLATFEDKNTENIVFPIQDLSVQQDNTGRFNIIDRPGQDFTVTRPREDLGDFIVTRNKRSSEHEKDHDHDDHDHEHEDHDHDHKTTRSMKSAEDHHDHDHDYDHDHEEFEHKDEYTEEELDAARKTICKDEQFAANHAFCHY